MPNHDFGRCDVLHKAPAIVGEPPGGKCFGSREGYGLTPRRNITAERRLCRVPCERPDHRRAGVDAKGDLCIFEATGLAARASPSIVVLSSAGSIGSRRWRPISFSVE